jgi:hypothetical protein
MNNTSKTTFTDPKRFNDYQSYAKTIHTQSVSRFRFLYRRLRFEEQRGVMPGTGGGLQEFYVRY